MSTTTVGGGRSSGGGAHPGGGESQAPAGRQMLRSSSNRVGERIILIWLQAAAILSVVITIGIVISLVVPAISFFQQISFIDFFTGTRWTPTFADPSYGVLPLIIGTLWTTAIGLIVAVPLGLGAAALLERPPSAWWSSCSHPARPNPAAARRARRTSRPRTTTRSSG